MPEHPLRALLSRIVQTSQDPSDFVLAYVHRGAQEDQLVIRVSTIGRLGKGWFMLEDGETQIPFHRVLYVKNEKTNLVLWEKRTPSRISARDP